MENKKIIGFLTQKIGKSNDEDTSFCGIGIKGKLTKEILENSISEKYVFITEYINSNYDVEQFIIKNNPLILIYNYHSSPTPYLNDFYIRNKYPNIFHVIIYYDLLQYHIDNFSPHLFNGYNYIITDNEILNINNNNENIFKVTRSIPYSKKFLNCDYRIDNIPIIGYQGFGFSHKGIHKIAIKVQEEFDEAILRLHIPYSYYGDPTGIEARERIKEVQNIITKPGIKIETSHDFLSDDEIIEFLNNNTINCYFYDYMESFGIASSPDYAIAAKRPIAINNSRMFLNLHNLSPSIEIEKISLKEIINNGITPLLPIYEKYTHKNVLKDYENICDKLLSSKL